MGTYDWGAQEIGAPKRRELRKVPAALGLLLEDVQTGWVGEVVRVEKSGGMRVVALEDRRGRTKSFRTGFGFLLEGEPVELVDPAVAQAAAPAAKAAPARSASGSVVVQNLKARTTGKPGRQAPVRPCCSCEPASSQGRPIGC